MILKTKIERIVYKKPESGWCIAKSADGIIKGVINFEVSEGDLVELEGQWGTSSFNGQKEFSFKSAVLSVPDNPRALLTYAIELTKGLGKAAEEQIWEKYGDKWIEAETLEIPRISEETQWHWKDTLQRLKNSKEQTQAISFLIGHNCTLNMSCAAWKAWAENTVSKVEKNPYILAELPRYGFADIENGIRQSFGIKDNDVRRIKAAVLYILNKLTDGGSTVCSVDEFDVEFQHYCPDGGARLKGVLKELVDADEICWVDLTLLCLNKDYEDEKSIWERFGGAA